MTDCLSQVLQDALCNYLAPSFLSGINHAFSKGRCNIRARWHRLFFTLGGMVEQVYRGRKPKASPLWQCLSHHFDEFLEAYKERFQPRYGFLRPIIPEVFEKFLECSHIAKYHDIAASSSRGPGTLFTLRKAVECPQDSALGLRRWSWRGFFESFRKRYLSRLSRLQRDSIQWDNAARAQSGQGCLDRFRLPCQILSAAARERSGN